MKVGLISALQQKWQGHSEAPEVLPCEPQQAAPAVAAEVLASMSHELRTPINAIVGYAELLLSPATETESAAARREYAQHILASGRQLQGMVDDVLDVMRVQNGTLSFSEQPFDGLEVMEVCVRGAHDAAEAADVRITARLIEGVEVLGDPRRLQQAIAALLSNAIKFSPRGSYVYVEMKHGPDGQLVVHVSDAGIGMETQSVERAFQSFVQLDTGATRRFGGVGVGLTLARHIANLHGGEIGLTSSPGAGTEARFVLPSSRVIWPSKQPNNLPDTRVA